MILKRLVEFADRVDLPISGHQNKLVTKVIQLSNDGKLAGLIANSGDKKGKKEGKTMLVPWLERTSGVKPRLIADNPDYVIGKAKEGEKNPEKVIDRHSSYISLLKECFDKTKCPQVGSIIAWIDSGGPDTIKSREDIVDDDFLIFEIDGIFPTKDKAVQDFWAVRREDVGKSAMCLVTGEFGPVVERMPVTIKGIPDGQMSGCVLVSVNNSSAESFGLSAALNSPISELAAEKICNSLNYLLEKSNGHCLWIGKTAFVFWTTSEEKTFSWNILDDPSPEDVKALLESPKRGDKNDNIDESDFFMLGLSASAARVVVRNQLETSLREIEEKLAKTWFPMLEIVDAYGGQPKPLGIYRLATSLYREAKDVPPDVPTQMLECALNGRPLPASFLAYAVKRNIAMQGPYYEFNKKKYLSTERMAIIKAIIGNQETQYSLKSLDLTNPEPAYHCGRLLAVLDSIQRSALGDVNSTLVDRFYGSASTSPGSVLGTLVNRVQPHLSKMRKEKGDGWAQVRLGEVMSAIGSEFPKTLNMRGQGLFALGFYHQKANDRASAIKSKELKDKTDEDDNENS